MLRRNSRFTHRSSEREWLDDLQLQGKALVDNLDEIATINHHLGGHQVLVDGVRRAMKLLGSSQHSVGGQGKSECRFRIVDIGCGSGDGLRSIARWARKRSAGPLELVGHDANPHVVTHAQALSKAYPEIRYEVRNALGTREQITETSADASPSYGKAKQIAICSLFLHHLSDTEIQKWIQLQLESSDAVVISDLERSQLAHGLFRTLSKVARFSDMTKHDGLISIRRGFRRKELERIATSSSARCHQLRWCWAFRYQMVLVA